MTGKKLTVFGGGGFIGSSIISKANEYGYNAVRADWRNMPTDENMGDIIYCLGVGDCKRPDDVINSHLSLLQQIVTNGNFNRLTYISSTRLYMGGAQSNENSNLCILPDDNRKLFNLAKMSAEAYLETSSIDYRIIRPSNVFGCAINSPLFLPSIVRDAVLKGEVNMYVPPDYAKDYVLVDDVSRLSLEITKLSLNPIYNVASGENISAQQIADILINITGCSVNWHDSECTDIFPITDITLVKQEYSFRPSLVGNLLGEMCNSFKQKLLS